MLAFTRLLLSSELQESMVECWIAGGVVGQAHFSLLAKGRFLNAVETVRIS